MRQIQGLPSPSYRKSIKFIRLFFNVINVQERSAKENQNPGWFFKYFEVGIKNENKNVKNSQLSNDQTVPWHKIILKQYLFVALQIFARDL